MLHFTNEQEAINQLLETLYEARELNPYSESVKLALTSLTSSVWQSGVEAGKREACKVAKDLRNVGKKYPMANNKTGVMKDYNKGWDSALSDLQTNLTKNETKD